MRRTNFNDDHETFRKTLRAFIETEVVPVFDEWFDAGQAPREFYYKLGDLGVFGIEVPEEYGGAGEKSFKYQAIMTEEVARAGVALGGSGVHVALCLPYLKAYATAEQKQRWLPGFVTGEINALLPFVQLRYIVGLRREIRIMQVEVVQKGEKRPPARAVEPRHEFPIDFGSRLTPRYVKIAKARQQGDC